MKYEEMEVRCVLTPTDELDLPEIDKVLLKKAHEAASKAYAPYSGFQVGSAVRMKSGAIVVGSNQENMAYPSGLCGERVAVFAAGAQFSGEDIEAVAIVSPSPIAVPSAFCHAVVADRFYSKLNLGKKILLSFCYRPETRSSLFQKVQLI